MYERFLKKYFVSNCICQSLSYRTNLKIYWWPLSLFSLSELQEEVNYFLNSYEFISHFTLEPTSCYILWNEGGCMKDTVLDACLWPMDFFFSFWQAKP